MKPNTVNSWIFRNFVIFRTKNLEHEEKNQKTVSYKFFVCIEPACSAGQTSAGGTASGWAKENVRSAFWCFPDIPNGILCICYILQIIGFGGKSGNFEQYGPVSRAKRDLWLSESTGNTSHESLRSLHTVLGRPGPSRARGLPGKSRFGELDTF